MRFFMMTDMKLTFQILHDRESGKQSDVVKFKIHVLIRDRLSEINTSYSVITSMK